MKQLSNPILVSHSKLSSHHQNKNIKTCFKKHTAIGEKNLEAEINTKINALDTFMLQQGANPQLTTQEEDEEQDNHSNDIDVIEDDISHPKGSSSFMTIDREQYYKSTVYYSTESL